MSLVRFTRRPRYPRRNRWSSGWAPEPVWTRLRSGHFSPYRKSNYGGTRRHLKGYVKFKTKYYLAINTERPPLWSSGQSSWLQIQSSGFDSRRYEIFWEVVGLERGTLSLVSTIEELLERKSSGSDQQSREYGRGDPLRWPRKTLYPQKLALTSPRSGGRSVCTVHSRTKATEF
jgi:hypothetical protein